MNIDPDQILMSLNDTPLRHAESDATFRDVVCAALSVDVDRGSDGTEKYKRFQLMVRLTQATGPIPLTTEERTLLKTHIGKTLPALFVGRIYDIIDPPNT